MSETLSYRVSVLEDELRVVKSDIKDILEHRLPAIEQQIAKLTATITIFGGLIISGITALIVMGLT